LLTSWGANLSLSALIMIMMHIMNCQIYLMAFKYLYQIVSLYIIRVHLNWFHYKSIDITHYHILRNEYEVYVLGRSNMFKLQSMMDFIPNLLIVLVESFKYDKIYLIITLLVLFEKVMIVYFFFPLSTIAGGLFWTNPPI
jgi:hypothetical protein